MNTIIIKGALILALIIGLAGGGYYASIKMGLLPNPFEAKDAYILETSTIVNEIKSIAELYSVCYYDQLVVDSVKVQGTAEVVKKSMVKYLTGYLAGGSITDPKLVLITSAKVFAGFDLGKLDSTDIKVKDSVITIQLPAPQIMDIVMNPSDVSTFIEEGEWSMEDVKMVKNKAIDKFRKRAIDRGIIADAEKKGRESIELFFKSLGFKEVIILAKNSLNNAKAD